MSFQPKSTVIVPIDFSESTQQALDTATECAIGNENIHVVHVIRTPDPPPPFGTWHAEDLTLRQKKAGERIRELLERNNLLGAEVVVLTGDPGRRIVQHINQVNADLVVIPSHGYSGFERLLLGSVAERVLRHADCPVYVLRRCSVPESGKEEAAK